MAEILGAVAASDQLIKTFTSLYKDLVRAYQTIRHARKEVKEVKRRTRTMTRLWRIFKETMENVSSIEEFSVDIKRYRKFDKGLGNHSQYVINRITDILITLHPLLTARRVSTWTKVRVRWTWLFQRKEELRLLYVDLELLAGYMKTFIDLVLLQIALKQYELNKSVATKIQVDSLGRALQAELRGIRHIQQTQLYTSSIRQEKEKDDFLLKVQKLVRRELANTPSSDAGKDLISNSSFDSSFYSSAESSESSSDSFTGPGPGPNPGSGPPPTRTPGPFPSHNANIPANKSLNPALTPGIISTSAKSSGPRSGASADSRSGSSPSKSSPSTFTSTKSKHTRISHSSQNRRHAPTKDIQPTSNSSIQPAISLKAPLHADLDGASAYSASSDSNFGVTQPIDGPSHKPSRVSQDSTSNPVHSLSSEISDHETEARHDLDMPTNALPHPSARQDAYAVNKSDRRKKLGYVRKGSRGSSTSLASENELPLQTRAQGARTNLSPRETSGDSFRIPVNSRNKKKDRGLENNRRELALA